MTCPLTFHIRTAVSAIALLFALIPAPLRASECAQWAERAGAAAGLPAGLLSAIALVESGGGGAGRGSGAWPWTLNQGGQSFYFDTRDEALSHLRAALDSGVTNVDVGCLQLNHRWHATGFSSLEDMIDPKQNAEYAASFMVALHERLGTWEAATRAYHSSDPTRGAAYLRKVSGAQTGFDPMILAAEDPPDEMFLDGLLQSTGLALFSMGGDGSLVDVPQEEENMNEARLDAYASAAQIPSQGAIPFDRQEIKLRARDAVAPMADRRWQLVEAFRADLARQSVD